MIRELASSPSLILIRTTNAGSVALRNGCTSGLARCDTAHSDDITPCEYSWTISDHTLSARPTSLLKSCHTSANSADMKDSCFRYNRLCIVITLVALITSVGAAQTRIDIPDNKYSLNDDVRIGRQAAAEIEKQLPLISERSQADNYIESVGRRLARAIPPRYRHRGFVYRFDVVNVRDINAFALPGGPLYADRGLIEAAANEGQLAGVLAHELAHIALRHGTAQATEAQSAKFQLPALGGAILGAIVGGNVGGLISQGTQTGLGIYFLRYKREYEEQADILGAQIMARAGYDPRDLAEMFRTIERRSGDGGPEFLSSHPNPGDRYERIIREANLLDQSRPARHDSAQFQRTRRSLLAMAPAPSMQQAISRRP